MRTPKAVLLLLILALLPALADAPSLSTIVSKKDYRAGQRMTERVARASGRSLSGDLPPISSVTDGDKLEYKMVVTAQPLKVRNIEGCVILTTAPIVSDAYATNSFIISTADIRIGSYSMNCCVLTRGDLKIGSYSSGNNIEAGSVSVGSDSTNTTYYAVTPRVGKPGRSDTLIPTGELSKAITF